MFGSPGARYPNADSLVLSIDAGNGQFVNCTLHSTDNRLWMTQYGPVNRGGGSCPQLLQGPMSA